MQHPARHRGFGRTLGGRLERAVLGLVALEDRAVLVDRARGPVAVDRRRGDERVVRGAIGQRAGGRADGLGVEPARVHDGVELAVRHPVGAVAEHLSRARVQPAPVPAAMEVRDVVAARERGLHDRPTEEHRPAYHQDPHRQIASRTP
jgi:hypothetical protein